MKQQNVSLRVSEDIALTPVRVSDAHQLFHLIEENRKHLSPWLPWIVEIQTSEAIEAFLAAKEQDAKEGKGATFCIWYKGELVGTLGFSFLTKRRKTANIEYMLAKEYTEKGIATKACKWLLEHIFRETGAEIAEIRCSLENRRSRKLAQRLGFSCRMPPQEVSAHHNRTIVKLETWYLWNKMK